MTDDPFLDLAQDAQRIEPDRPLPVPAVADIGLPGDAPLITVVIPTYNRAALVQEAIGSVAAQSWPNVETIVVDDGSTDDTERAVRALAKTLATPGRRLALLRQANRGPAAARNRGIEAARGDYLMLLDSDDLLDPDALAILAAALADARRPLALARIRSARLDGSRVAESGGGVPQFTHATFEAHWMTHAALYRRSTWESAGPFNESLRYGEDAEWQWRIARLFDDPAILPHVIGTRRLHDQGHFSMDSRGTRDLTRYSLDPWICHAEWLRARGLRPYPLGRRALLGIAVASTRAGAVENWAGHAKAAELLEALHSKGDPLAALCVLHARVRSTTYCRLALGLIEAARGSRDLLLRIRALLARPETSAVRPDRA